MRDSVVRILARIRGVNGLHGYVALQGESGLRLRYIDNRKESRLGIMGNRVKAELRQEMRKILANLDRRWLQAASRELCKNLTSLLNTKNDLSIEHILAWVHFFPGEVDLSEFINEQIDQRTVYLPQLRDGQMQFSSIGKDWHAKMSQGGFGIPEPSQGAGRIFSPSDAANAVILVPGLAFDSSGGRIGRGKGYYDTFLGRSRLFDIIKIGVCWSIQKVSEVPMESHDAYMDWIVTEEEVLQSYDPVEGIKS